MGFEHKPGYGRLFRNEQRTGKQPHISGSAALPDGRGVKIAVWDNDGKLNLKIEFTEASAEAPTHRMSAQQRQWEQEGKSIFTGIPKKVLRTMDEEETHN